MYTKKSCEFCYRKIRRTVLRGRKEKGGNCNESITLRPQPDVNSGEICQIPLGETVSYVGAAENGFYEICYMGKNGYALADYLTFVN